MQRSLRRITSALCRRYSVSFFFTNVQRMVYMLGARGILPIVGRRYRNFLLPDCNPSLFSPFFRSLFPSAKRILRLYQYCTDYIRPEESGGSFERAWPLSFFIFYIYFVSLWNFCQRDFFFSCIQSILAFSWQTTLFKISRIHDGRFVGRVRETFEKFFNDLSCVFSIFPRWISFARKPRIKSLHCDIKET